MRVVSLLPSATELICEVGARGSLVGVSHECDHPKDVVGLPALTAPRVRLPSASDAIDRAVREAMLDALSIYLVDAEALRTLRPDVVVTQDLCDVCAVSLEDVTCALAPLGHHAPNVLSLRPTRLAHVIDDLRRVGDALGRPQDGVAAAARMQAGFQALAARVRGQPRKTVLTLEWTDPVMVGGTWMPELIHAAGGEPLVAEAGAPSPTLHMDELERLDPDVVLVKPCGYDLHRALADISVLQRTLPWTRWRAISRGDLYIADGNALFNRSGPRLLDSAELIAACLHPAVVPDLVARHGPMVRRVDAKGTARRIDAR